MRERRGVNRNWPGQLKEACESSLTFSLASLWFHESNGKAAGRNRVRARGRNMRSAWARRKHWRSMTASAYHIDEVSFSFSCPPRQSSSSLKLFDFSFREFVSSQRSTKGKETAAVRLLLIMAGSWKSTCSAFSRRKEPLRPLSLASPRLNVTS